jgi:hypothetical protein
MPAPVANNAPAFPDDDDFEEPDAAPAPPARAPAPIANKAPAFPDEGFSDDDEPPAVPPPPPAASAPIEAVKEVIAAPVESAKKAYESIKETLVGPSDPEPAAGGAGGKCAKVLFDYEATEDNELALREGEILTEVDMIDEGWWSAKGEKGDVGLVSGQTADLAVD